MKINPVINFDVNNKEHREDFYTFTRTKCLGKLKNKYSLEGCFGDIVSMMTEKVANFYIQKEFE